MEKNKKTLHIIAWILQGIMAAMFLMAGFMKSFTPVEQLPENLSWGKEMPGLLRFVGISELLGAIGLILPSLLRIAPFLSVLAATGFSIIMILAAGFHTMRNEYHMIPVNLVLLLISLVIIWLRWKKVPVQPKNNNAV